MDECTLWSRIMQHFRESCSELDGLWIKRRRFFSTEKMVRGLLHLVAGCQKSYFQVLDELCSVAPAPSSFCEARAKFPSFVIAELRRGILDLCNEAACATRWHGYRLHAVDGTKVTLPRPLFEYGFKAPTGCHYPQGLVSLLVRLDDRMVCDIRLTSSEDERREAHEHLPHLSQGDLVIYDRGYLSFSLLTAHLSQGIEGVFRVTKGVSFLPIKEFWKGSKQEAVVTIDPTPETYRIACQRYPEYEHKPIKLRLIKYKIKKETYVLATTILDPTIDCKEFIDLYPKRWTAEESFKALKQTLEFETFHAHSENGVEQEVEATALFWNLVQALGSLAEPILKKILALFNFIARLSNKLPSVPLKGSPQFA